jgi:hypothetical protein
MENERNWRPTAVKIALLSTVTMPILDRPYRMLTGAEELSTPTVIDWTIGALGWLALVGLISFIMLLASGPDR